jgi:hypothetical protein
VRRIAAVLCAIFLCKQIGCPDRLGTHIRTIPQQQRWLFFGLAAGVDYPKPIVDHATVHKINMGRMKASYDRKLYGQPAAATASHPLAPALRQVGSASEGETDTGTASADMGNGDRKAAPASAAATADGCGPTAAKKSRT